MLLELAIGDAYGAGFEYVDTEMIRWLTHWKMASMAETTFADWIRN